MEPGKGPLDLFLNYAEQAISVPTAVKTAFSV
jgi:hypothetical protein